jgi:hypothetical protein
LLGTLANDGGTCDIYEDVVPSAGNSITRMSSTRRVTRSCGHISVSDCLAQWTELGVELGNLESVEVVVESVGGSGRIDVTTARVVLD